MGKPVPFQKVIYQLFYSSFLSSLTKGSQIRRRYSSPMRNWITAREGY